LVMVWLVGWRRGRQLYERFYEEELVKLKQELTRQEKTIEKAKPRKVAPEPKADAKEEIRKDKMIREDKKAHKGNVFKNIRKYFRRKKP
ncbi:MAG: hypothetical protein V3S04_06075, partial [Candidatus Omnitrophota bacterium]